MFGRDSPDCNILLSDEDFSFSEGSKIFLEGKLLVSKGQKQSDTVKIALKSDRN